MLGVARNDPDNLFPSQVSCSRLLLFAFENPGEYKDDDGGNDIDG